MEVTNQREGEREETVKVKKRFFLGLHIAVSFPPSLRYTKDKRIIIRKEEEEEEKWKRRRRRRRNNNKKVI
jgi:hypothetical protein